MNSMSILEMLECLDYKCSVDDFICIGDLTAIRNKGSLKYRKNYERGILLCALVEYFGLHRMLEFGTGRGYAAACVSSLTSIEEVVTIDKEKPRQAKALMRQAGVSLDNISFITANANQLQPKSIPGTFDLFFIDAQHDGASVRSNFELCSKKARDKFVVVFDDYRNKFPSVKKQIDKIGSLDQKILVHTDGWLISNPGIKVAKDADVVREGREYGSGLVVGLKGYQI